MARVNATLFLFKHHFESHEDIRGHNVGFYFLDELKSVWVGLYTIVKLL